MIQFVSFSNNMEYEDADDAEDVKAGSFYTTPNGTNTSFSFFREDDENYYMDYPYLKITEETIGYIIKDCGYNPSEYDTDEFKENLKIGTPCNCFVTSVFDRERFVYFLHSAIYAVEFSLLRRGPQPSIEESASRQACLYSAICSEYSSHGSTKKKSPASILIIFRHLYITLTESI